MIDTPFTLAESTLPIEVDPNGEAIKDVDEINVPSVERRLSLTKTKSASKSKKSKTVKKKRTRKLNDEDRGVFRSHRPPKFIKAGGESPTNIPFEKSIHEEDIDYFRLTLPMLQESDNRIEVMRDFLNEWMKLDPNTESVSISQMTIDKITVGNRFKVIYTSKDPVISKVYFFDVDFQDDKIDMTKYRRAKYVAVDTEEDYEYAREYQHTLGKDCSSIKDAIKNCVKITCTPLVNENSYIVKGVYNVVSEVKVAKGIMKFKNVYVADGEMQAKASSSNVDKMPKVPKHNTVYDMAVQKVKATGNKFMMFDIRRKEVQQRADEAEAKIDKFVSVVVKKAIRDETAYVAEVKDETWAALSKQRLRETAHIRTLELLRNAAAEINAFHVDVGLRMMNHLIDYIDKYKAYNSMSNFYKSEIKVTKLIDYLDYLWYLRDKELDDKYEKYLRP